MVKSNHRPRYNYKRPKAHLLPTSEAIDGLVVNAALLLLTASHKVPADLYKIVEERQLGHIICVKAEESGDKQLYYDAIAQWG